MNFEGRTKESFKTALAMVLAYAIALSLDWKNPYWAGIAVAVVSLPTAGQSIEKGAMRLLGTLMASIAAMILISMHPQERWFFMAYASVYVGFCSYMMIGSKHQYFWLVSGFVALIICVDGGANPQTAFETAVTRSLETALGIIVYTLVSVFLWPRSSASQLEETAQRLLGSQRELFDAYRRLASKIEDQVESTPSPGQEMQLLARVLQLLNGAASESFHVRERRDDWLRFYQESNAFMWRLESWRTSFPEIRHLDLQKLIPNLEEVYGDIGKTFDEIELAWAGKPLVTRAINPELIINRSEALRLSPLDRAALVLMKTNLAQLAIHCYKTRECVRALKGPPKACRGKTPHESTPSVPPADSERISGVLNVMATLWGAFLIWIYVDPPGDAAFVQMSGTFALVMLTMPQALPSMLFQPFALGSGFAGIIYLVIMPHLSGFTELAAVLFAAVFIISFIFHRPQQGLSKLAGFITLLVITSVQNQQSYSFSQFATTLILILLAIMFVVALSYLPFSPRPEKVFLRLLSRYINSGAYLLNRLERVCQRPRWIDGKWKSEQCRYNLQNLPGRIEQVSHGIDFRDLGPNSRDQILELLSSVRTLGLRILAVEEAHRHRRPSQLSRNFCDELAEWRRSLLNQLQGWGQSGPSDSHNETTIQLQQRPGKSEMRIHKEIGSFQGERENDEFYAKTYELLGSYRGLSEAVSAFSKASSHLDWSRWREARF